MKGKAKNPTIAVWLYITKNIKCRLSSSTLFKENSGTDLSRKPKTLYGQGCSWRPLACSFPGQSKVFVACVSGNLSKKSLPRPISRIFFPMFSSRNFMFSDLRFKSWIYVKSIFVSGIRYKLSFILLTHLFFWCIYIQFSQIHFIEETVRSLGLLVKNQLAVYMGVYVWTLHSVPLICRPVFMTTPYSFDCSIYNIA